MLIFAFAMALFTFIYTLGSLTLLALPSLLLSLAILLNRPQKFITRCPLDGHLLGQRFSSGSLLLYTRIGGSEIDGFRIRSSCGVNGRSAAPRMIALVTGLSMLLSKFHLSFTKSTSVALTSSSTLIATCSDN